MVDSNDQLLLFEYVRATGERYWAIPGGGLEDGESFEEAATREALEELGLSGPKLVQLRDRTVELPLSGRLILQHERLFLLRATSLVFDDAVLEFDRREGIHQSRWWSSIELAATKELVYPENVAAILSEIVTRG